MFTRIIPSGQLKSAVLLMAMMLSLSSHSQEVVKISANTYDGFTGAPVPIYDVTIEGVEAQKLLAHWDNYIKSETKAKTFRDEITVRANYVYWKVMGTTTPVNIFMKFEQGVKTTRMFVAVHDSVHGFIDREHMEFGARIEQVIYRECMRVYIQVVGADIKNEEKRLKTFEKRFKSTKKQEDRLRKDNNRAQRNIDRLKSDIEIDNSVLEELNASIGETKGILNNKAHMPKDIRKAHQKELNAHEKRRSRIKRAIDKAHKEIFKLENQIRDNEFELDKLKQEEDFVMGQIMNQREKIQMLKEEKSKLERK